MSLPIPAALLTFLVLEPELLLDLLAGEVDGAAELGAIQCLRDVVRAKLLDEGEQLLPAAVLIQDLQDVRKACGREAGDRQVGQAGLPATARGEGRPEDPLLKTYKSPHGCKAQFLLSCLHGLHDPLESTTCCLPWAVALASCDSSPYKISQIILQGCVCERVCTRTHTHKHKYPPASSSPCFRLLAHHQRSPQRMCLAFALQ